VTSLHKAGKAVDCAIFIGDGDGIQEWFKNFNTYRKAEDFLALHLGRRPSRFNYSQLNA
jgi:hypothetical protein